MGGSHWTPNKAGKDLVPGRSDREKGFIWMQKNPNEPIRTTYERSAAAIEAYWRDRKSNQEAQEAAKPKWVKVAEASKVPELPMAQRDNIVLGSGEGFHVPSAPGSPRDISEKEYPKLRGVPGYTGTQPRPDQSSPERPFFPSPDPDPARTYAINATDERRGWVKGRAGYGGHQLPFAERQPAPQVFEGLATHEQQTKLIQDTLADQARASRWGFGEMSPYDEPPRYADPYPEPLPLQPIARLSDHFASQLEGLPAHMARHGPWPCQQGLQVSSPAGKAPAAAAQHSHDDRYEPRYGPGIPQQQPEQHHEQHHDYSDYQPQHQAAAQQPAAMAMAQRPASAYDRQLPNTPGYHIVGVPKLEQQPPSRPVSGRPGAMGAGAGSPGRPLTAPSFSPRPTTYGQTHGTVFTPWMREDTLRHHKDPPGYYNVNTAEIKFGGLLNGPALTRVNLQQPNLSLGRGAVGR